MTLEGARSTGQNAATRFGRPWQLYRLPAWPEGVYGVRAVDVGLPPEAVDLERFEPATSIRQADDPQGSLF